MIFVIAYILGVILFCLWDSFIGFPINFDNTDAPPLSLAAIFWFVATPIMIIIYFCMFLDHFKDRRIKKQSLEKELKVKREKLRVAKEEEIERNLKEVDLELEQYNKMKSK